MIVPNPRSKGTTTVIKSRADAITYSQRIGHDQYQEMFEEADKQIRQLKSQGSGSDE